LKPGHRQSGANNANSWPLTWWVRLIGLQPRRLWPPGQSTLPLATAQFGSKPHISRRVHRSPRDSGSQQAVGRAGGFPRPAGAANEVPDSQPRSTSGLHQVENLGHSVAHITELVYWVTCSGNPAGRVDARQMLTLDAVAGPFGCQQPRSQAPQHLLESFMSSSTPQMAQCAQGTIVSKGPLAEGDGQNHNVFRPPVKLAALTARSRPPDRCHNGRGAALARLGAGHPGPPPD